MEWLPLHVLNIACEVGYGSCPLPHVSVTEHSHDGEHRVIGELRIGVVFAGISGDIEEDQFLYEFLDVLCAGLGIHLLMFENHGLGLLPLRVECSTSSYGSVTRFDHINMVTGCIKTLATIDASGISS